MRQYAKRDKYIKNKNKCIKISCYSIFVENDYLRHVTCGQEVN